MSSAPVPSVQGKQVQQVLRLGLRRITQNGACTRQCTCYPAAVASLTCIIMQIAPLRVAERRGSGAAGLLDTDRAAELHAAALEHCCTVPASCAVLRCAVRELGWLPPGCAVLLWCPAAPAVCPACSTCCAGSAVRAVLCYADAGQRCSCYGSCCVATREASYGYN